jgi:hypothetical protein
MQYINGETIRMPERQSHIAIVLDKPLYQYISILSTLHNQYKHVYVRFLCDGPIPPTSHFSIWLQECGIMHECLNIPVNEWEEWKKRPDYKGE